MFGLLKLLFKLSIYLGAPLTILVAIYIGPELLGMFASGMDSWIGHIIGGLLGILVASIVFGLPLILLSIHANLITALTRLEALQRGATPPPLPSLVDTVLLPVMAERTLDRILGD